MKVGIIGLPNVGKSTIFNALTASDIPANNYPFCTIEPNVGIVPVPDIRLEEINQYNFPSILAIESIDKSNKLSSILNEKIKVPFTIFDFKEKIISAIAKNEFKKNSLINLKGYTIDKNERKIKKNNLELQLSEKEIDFLILFSENKNPIKRDSVLKKVWNYSRETETHTVETHIHRLRKKISEKFNDKDFIKNNKKGYFI